MGRNKEEQARMEGMAQALRIAKAKGIDGLEADLKMRNITGLPCAVSRAAMDECIMNIKYNVVDMKEKRQFSPRLKPKSNLIPSAWQ